MLSFAAGWRSSRVGSIVTCSGPAPLHRPAPSRSLACSPRRDGGARTAGGGCAGAGSGGAVWKLTCSTAAFSSGSRRTSQEVPLEFDVCVCFSEAEELAP